MINTMLGRKREMSQAFLKGERVPVTKIEAGPCVVTQIVDYDGFWGIQLGFGQKRIKNITKPIQGHLKKAGAIKKNLAPSFIAEIRVEKKPNLKLGNTLLASDVFSVGDSVRVTGTSKGKGFAGVMKRWDFKGGPRTHGQSDRLRAPGSIGQGTDPGRVRKGKKMAGRMGGERKVVYNLIVLGVDPEKNEIMVSGPVPGRLGGYLTVQRMEKTEEQENE